MSGNVIVKGDNLVQKSRDAETKEEAIKYLTVAQSYFRLGKDKKK